MTLCTAAEKPTGDVIVTYRSIRRLRLHYASLVRVCVCVCVQVPLSTTASNLR